MTSFLLDPIYLGFLILIKLIDLFFFLEINGDCTLKFRAFSCRGSTNHLFISYIRLLWVRLITYSLVTPSCYGNDNHNTYITNKKDKKELKDSLKSGPLLNTSDVTCPLVYVFNNFPSCPFSCS